MLISLILASFLTHAQDSPQVHKLENSTFKVESPHPGVDRNLVRKAISDEKVPIKKCYNDRAKELSHQPLSGKTVLRFKVAAEGKVTEVKVIKSTDKLLDQCISAQIKKTLFPLPPKDASYFVEYPFLFNSDKSKYTVDRAAVRKIIKKERAEIKSCFTEHKTKSGKIIIAWTVNDIGKVTKTNIVKKLEVPVGKCIQSLIRSLSFPKAPKGKDYSVEYPFSFTSTK